MKTHYSHRERALLLALGLGASTLAQAQSAVQITGLIDIYAGSLHRSGDSRISTVGSSGMSTSYWGFKGTEDLGGGLKAHFNLTGFIRPALGAMGRSNADTMFARDANVGLSGGFGRLSLGRDLAPNFIPSVSLTPFGGISPFSPLTAHTIVPSGGYYTQRWAATVAGDTGWSNEVVYTSPDLGGMTASLFYQLGEQAGKNNAGANAMYRHGALSLGAYYQRVALNNPVDATVGPSQVFRFQPYNATTGAVYTLAPAIRQNTWFIGGAYDFQAVKLFATVQQARHELAPGADRDRFDLKSNTLQLGASVPVGAGQVLLSAARTRVQADADYTAIFGRSDWTSAIRRTSASVGYDYFLSKRTDLYAVTMHDKISAMPGELSLGLGIRHRF
jgi:predicted porin